MTCHNPYILLYSYDSLNEKIQSFGEFEFRLEDVLKMFYEFPLLFGYRLETIRERISFFHAEELDALIFEKPEILFFSVDLLKKRLKFLKKQDKKYKLDNDLFLSESMFYKKFHVTREELWKEEG